MPLCLCDERKNHENRHFQLAALRCTDRHGLFWQCSASNLAGQTRSRPDLSADSRHRASWAEHTPELQSLMPTSYAVFCLQTKPPQPAHLTSQSHTTKPQPL